MVLCCCRYFHIARHRRDKGAEHIWDFNCWDIMKKIFISYSRKDMDFVRKLAGDLETAGYDVWWDITDLQGGDA